MNESKSKRRVLVIGALSLQLAGCAGSHVPKNQEVALFSPEKAATGQTYDGQAGGLNPDAGNSSVCPPSGTPNFILPASAAIRHSPLRDSQMRYSPGDRLNITVPGLEDFSGDFVINADSRIILPFAGEIQAKGTTNAELSKRVENAFVKAGIFKQDGLRLTVRPVQYAPINITVSGAVFQPGRTTINNIKDSDKTEKVLTKFGDAPLDRFVPSALKAAGGVRPDADISRIALTRNGHTYTLDWRGAFTGQPVDDAPLIEGDHIDVPLGACFQSGLVRVSQITPPGVRLFMSNLIVPALSNANAAVGQFSTGVPYGTRMLTALVSANCVGGSLASNAARHAVLISRNPKTLQTEVTQRAIEELIQSADRDAINPHLMPDDALACYDSTVTDIKEAAGALGSLMFTGSTVKLLVK